VAPITILISDGFSSGDYSTVSTSFDIILGGLVNPVSKKPSSTFQVQTQDSSGNLIADITSGVTV
jgi:hypothetical protein